MAAKPDQGILALEQELMEERASALRRVSERLEALLEDLRVTERRVASSEGGRERERLIRHHDELRAAAERQRWYLLVQREALGLLHQAIVYELYPIPARLGR